MIPDTAGSNNRDMEVPLVTEILFNPTNRRILVVLAGANLFQLFTEVAAGRIGVFYDHGIGEAAVSFVPFPGDQLGGLD